MYANVSETGLVTALGNGTARIRARAQDASGASGFIDVAISGQPVDGTLRFSLTSEGGTQISATQPAYYVISTSEVFSSSAQTMQWKRAAGGLVEQALPPGTYYLWAFHDLNDNGAMDEGELFTAAADYHGGPQAIFTPKPITIGSAEDVTIEPGKFPALGAAGSWAWPANAGTLQVSLGYSGSSGPVSSTNRLFLGVSTDGDLTQRSHYLADIGLEENDRTALAILSTGTYYLSAFFDHDGNAELAEPLPSPGDPAQVYDGKAFASGEGEGEDFYAHPIGLTSVVGSLATIVLDDVLVFP